MNDAMATNRNAKAKDSGGSSSTAPLLLYSRSVSASTRYKAAEKKKKIRRDDVSVRCSVM